MIEQAAWWFADHWAINFFDPQKRLFWGYLLAALVLALLWMVLARRNTIRGAIRDVFSQSIWWSRSARADYLMFTFNSMLLAGLLPRLLGNTAVAYYVFELLHTLMEGRSATGGAVSATTIAVSFTVTLIMVLGANAIKFALNMVGANLRHSEVPLRYWRWLENIVMSPAQHQIHHSIDSMHYDKNFGVGLALWDRAFNTHCHSLPNQKLRYGIVQTQRHPHSLTTLYLQPFYEASNVLITKTERALLHCKIPLAGTSFVFDRTKEMISSNQTFRYVVLFLVTLFGLSAITARAADDVVNVYSARKEALILPLLERFKAETGIDFKLITGKADGLLKRIEIEGEASPADLFITVDAGRLQRAKAAGILQPIENAVLVAAVPSHLRDSENYWFGLSRRARVMFYAKNRVDPAELSTYEALAEDKWRGRLCIRSSSNVYNQSLTASMIVHIGVEQTEAWAKGLVANFARKPGGGDTDQLRAVAAGQCDVTVVNSYYFGRMINSSRPTDAIAADKIGVFWPNQNDRGAHVNVSGAGVTRHAKNPLAAQKLLEFMVTGASQSWYAEVNNEYPVVPDARISQTLEDFGDFTSDTLNLTLLGENNRAALQLMDRVGWR